MLLKMRVWAEIKVGLVGWEGWLVWVLGRVWWVRVGFLFFDRRKLYIKKTNLVSTKLI